MCSLCADKGLIRVNYEDGNPFDIAICRCRNGQFFRVSGPDFVRLHWLPTLTEANRIAWLEDFDDVGEPSAPALDVTDAGRKKAQPARKIR